MIAKLSILIINIHIIFSIIMNYMSIDTIVIPV